MVYISKKNKFKDLIHNKNIIYYISFLLIFMVIIAAIIFINKNHGKVDDNNNLQLSSENITSENLNNNETTSVSSGSYLIKVNKANNQVTVLSYSEKSSEYDIPVKYMICSVNKDLALGTYKTSDFKNTCRIAWNKSESGCWRFSTFFNDSIIFHSCLYSVENNKNSLNASDYNLLGENTDKAGISLLICDAKWIYENCSFESTILIYSDEADDISDKIANKITLPAGITWDPTDDSNGTPWCKTKIKSLSADKDFKIEAGNTSSLILAGHVKALDEKDTDITSYVYITGKYNNTPGTYVINFNIADIWGNVISKQATVTVEEQEKTISETSSDETTSNDIIDETTIQEDKESNSNTAEVSEDTSAAN